MDNYYNSPALAKFLKLCNRDCVGTVRVNRKVMQKKLQEGKLQKDMAIEQHSRPFVSCGGMKKKCNNDLNVSCS
jgi:predicted rRNA methylase YqxC with S4 and FtsJ domains